MFKSLVLGNYLFAPNGRFEPCGMFTAPHIIAVFICFLIIITSIIILKRKANEKLLKLLCKVSAPLLTVLELLKMTHSFINGDLNLDAWFPLSFCGLFIIAAWLSGYSHSRLKNFGDVFIAYGCPVGGITFMILPTTSLMSYPIWHYFSLYSLLFHSLMILLGVLFLINEGRLTRKRYLTYIEFIVFFSVISITMNAIWGCNIMNLREPYNIPIAFMQNMFSAFPPLYTAFVLTGYLLIPAVIGGLCGKIRKTD